MKKEHEDLFIELLVNERERLINEKREGMRGEEMEKKLTDYKERIEKLTEEVLILKAEKQCFSITNNKYNLMINYAKAKGFEFASAEKMKEFLNWPV